MDRVQAIELPLQSETPQDEVVQADETQVDQSSSQEPQAAELDNNSQAQSENTDSPYASVES